MSEKLELSAEIFAFLKKIRNEHGCIIALKGGIKTPYLLTMKFPKELQKETK